MAELETIDLEQDEIEAIRLSDLKGLYQEQAAEQMGISRQTLGNILKRARCKVAKALLCSKAIQLKKANHPQPCCKRKGRGHCGKHT